MLVKAFCPKCHRRFYLVRLVEGVGEYCPQCGGRLKPEDDRESPGETTLNALLEKLPLTEVGSREKPVYLDDEELLLLGKSLIDSLSSMGAWTERSRDQLEREAQRLRQLIAFLEDKGYDPLLRKIEFLMLSSFIKNYFG